jgi:hypothetical protein
MPWSSSMGLSFLLATATRTGTRTNGKRGWYNRWTYGNGAIRRVTVGLTQPYQACTVPHPSVPKRSISQDAHGFSTAVACTLWPSARSTVTPSQPWYKYKIQDTRYKIQEQQEQHKNNSVPEQYKREKQEQHTSQYTTLLIQE